MNTWVPLLSYTLQGVTLYFGVFRMSKYKYQPSTPPHMKELGSCPRCDGTEIKSLNLYYGIEEVCNNCGFVDTYRKHGAQDVAKMFYLRVIIAIIGFGGIAAFIFMS